MTNSRVIRLPKLAASELKEIKLELELETDKEALIKMANFSKLGRLNFNKKDFRLRL